MKQLHPNADTLENIPDDMVEPTVPEGYVCLADLNDDCLESVCRQLCLKDRISFAMTCKRWANVFILFFKHEYKSLNTNQLRPLSLWYQRLFFQLMGKHIAEIKISLYSKDDLFLQFISDNCHNLASIHLQGRGLTGNTVRSLLQSSKNLKELSMHCCMLNDSLIWPLKYHHSLERLSLQCNESISGQYISTIPNLKSLSLCFCKSLDPKHFNDICLFLKLRELDISGCPRLGAAQFELLAKHQNELEVLKLKGSIFYQYIFQLPALKSLHIYGSDDVPNEDFFDGLSNLLQLEKIGRLTQLKKLELPHNEGITDNCLEYFKSLKNLEVINVLSSSVSSRGVLELLVVCKKLKYIDVRSCKGITKQFYQNAIEILKKREESSKLKVKVLRTKINSDDWSIRAAEYKDLLELVFTAYY